MGDVPTWNTDDVASWLEESGFHQYIAVLSEEHKVDGPVLLTLTEADLRQPPLQITILGDIKRLMIAINSLQQSNHVNNRGNDMESPRSFQSRRVRSLKKRRYTDRPLSMDSLTDEADTSDANDSFLKKRSKHLKPEIWKTVLSFFYVFFVFLLTSFVMVIVHDRVPDMQKYPPLPDLFLDNIPYIPWAFEVCELVGVILLMVWSVILIFHKHRFILMRRMFSLAGTVFLLRCVTMLITSLSVPGVHLQCEGKAYGDIWAKLHRTLMIWRGFGMTLQGVRTCGDYMFSGHTVIITMLNFFITEYTHRNTVYFLHTFTWILNMFGIFFIMAAHEHYSIDVFVAFYITTRLFLYYHTLANNRALAQTDSSRTRIWFPLFSFFESQCEGAVPNEYEWPLPWPNAFIKFFHGRLKKLR